ncbi:MAG TPA: response regulator transcription factor [Rhizobiaceae bacterium]
MNMSAESLLGETAGVVQRFPLAVHTEPIESRCQESVVVIVDKRALERECLARGLVEYSSRTLKVLDVESLDEFKRMPNEADVCAVVVSLGGRNVSDEDVCAELVDFIAAVGPTPVIVVAESDEPADILATLECGAKGYIPTSLKVRIAAEAICLVRAGGTFAPASSMFALSETIHASRRGIHPLKDMFTAREASVVDALRQGKANKIIAYELNLCESTVKVHIRNIMKKLKATNRTEVAYKLREIAF